MNSIKTAISNILNRQSAVLLLAAFSLSPAVVGQQVSVVEHPLATRGEPYALTSGPDGAVWFGAAGIGRITVAGNISYFPEAAPNATIYGITTGPDGALWFTEPSSIGRITTEGVATHYPLLPGDDADSIVTGPDGALWFTDGAMIGRITTAGVESRFPVPSGGSEKIVVGPDGALWFTEGFTGKIGRITTDGDVTEFALPGPFPNVGAEPYGITVGGDSALWYSDLNGLIGRLTTSGQLTQYPVPLSQIGVNGIVSGPDGDLWFTAYNFEDGAFYLCRSTLEGAITATSVSVTAQLPDGDLINGPDGDFWFEQPSAYRIGQFQFPTAALSIATKNGRVGTPLTVSGMGFAPGEQINLFADSASAYPLGRTTADSNGDFVFNSRIWIGTYLDHSIRAVGTASGNFGLATFQVRPASIPNQQSVAAGGTFSVRGSGFAAFQKINVKLAQDSRNPIGSGTADYRGQFTNVTATMPATVAPGTVQIWVGGYPTAVTAIQVTP